MPPATPTGPELQSEATVDQPQYWTRFTSAGSAGAAAGDAAPRTAAHILQERARLLAQEPPAPTTGEVLMVVEFTLGSEHYGVDSTLVREVYPLKDYTPLPGTPNFILGIMNVRGQILSITDLGTLFALPLSGLRTANRVIILSHNGREFAILVDAIVGIRAVLLSALHDTLPTLTGWAGEFIQGITPDRLTVLNGKKLLTDDRLIVNYDSGGEGVR